MRDVLTLVTLFESHFVSFNSNTTGGTSGAGTLSHSVAPEFTSCLVRVVWWFVSLLVIFLFLMMCSNNWKCLYQVRVIAVFPVFRLLTDFVCLFTYEFCLSLWKIVRCSGNLLLHLFTQLYRAGQFYKWRKPEYPKINTDKLPVTDKGVSSAHRGIRTHICSDDRHKLHS